MTTDTSALSRAIQYLRAVEVAPDCWAFKPHKDFQGYLVVGSDALSGIDKRLDIFGTSEAIAHFLGTGSFVRMPAWWSPEHRTAVRIKSTLELVPDMATAERYFERGTFRKSFVECITADLTTGEEVPA
jgi:hypothetical protein